jgi:hypothetical protein
MKRYFAVFAFPIFLFLAAAPDVFGQTVTPAKLARVGSEQIPFELVSHAFAEWQEGTFVYVRDRFTAAPVFQFFDRDGHETSTFNFSIPKASLINLYDNSVALGRDGSLAIIGTAFSDDSREGMFAAWVSPNRQEQTIIRTSPFFPRAVALASDGTIWLAGDETKPHHQTPDYSRHLIRHYDKAGRLLGSFISWTGFETDSPTLPPTLQSILLPLKDGIDLTPSSCTS